jgi:hypothetical protein
VGHLVGRGAIFSVIFVTGLMPFLFRISDRLITGTFKSRHERRKEKIRHFRKNLREKMAQGRLIDGVKEAEDKW